MEDLLSIESPCLLSRCVQLTLVRFGVVSKQLVDEFVRKEGISFSVGRPAEVLLGRDTRPSGESLLEAAKHVLYLLFMIIELFFDYSEFVRTDC